jgi:hypothetical protein
MILGLLVILSLLEIAAYFTHGAIPVIASRAWVFMGIAYFAATAILVVRALLSDLRNRKFVFALLVIGLGLIVFYRLGDMYHLQVNYESAEELASLLTFNIHKRGWGYTGHVFVGYPARQFIIVAIPSLLFGNEVFWLQLATPFFFTRVFYLSFWGYAISFRSNNMASYRIALKEAAEWILQIDSDGQCGPVYFERFLNKASGEKIIYGWRESRDDGWRRLWISRFVTLFAFAATGIWVRDGNVPYRLMHRTTLENLCS